MAEFKEIYDIISNYVTNPLTLKVMTGMFVTGGIYYFYQAARTFRKIQKMDNSNLERTLEK